MDTITTEEKNDFKKRWKKHITNLLKERYPEYDENRYYFHPGDIVELDNRAEVVIMYEHLKMQEVLVLKSGFGMKKGEILKVPIDKFPYIKKDEFVNKKFNIKSEKNIKWEVGDVIEDKGCIFALYEGCKNSPDFYGLMLKPKKELEKTYPVGSRLHIFNPHREFFMNE